MSHLQLPEGYAPNMSVRETEQAIKELRIYFEEALCEALDLSRISAPLFVLPETGLNDNLNEVERAVSFDVPDLGGREAQIVHSLAKWKRYALGQYGFPVGKGLYTNMNAIRRDEELDNIHSLYVDQWDWELIIEKSQRNEGILKSIVRRIYEVLKHTEEYIVKKHGQLERILPEEITFLTAQEMEDAYPDLTPPERETECARKYGAIFIMQIGGKLKSGQPHDGRAADYDDWTMNGDIVCHYPVLDRALELSSMGIRVDEEALVAQLSERGQLGKLEMPYHTLVSAGKLPYTIGGGIGQSRLCMFMLRKAHIGEVQASVWPEDMARACAAAGIHLL